MELVIIITLIFNSECCRKSFHMACGIISISVSGITQRFMLLPYDLSVRVVLYLVSFSVSKT